MIQDNFVVVCVISYCHFFFEKEIAEKKLSKKIAKASAEKKISERADSRMSDDKAMDTNPPAEAPAAEETAEKAPEATEVRHKSFFAHSLRTKCACVTFCVPPTLKSRSILPPKKASVRPRGRQWSN